MDAKCVSTSDKCESTGALGGHYCASTNGQRMKHTTYLFADIIVKTIRHTLEELGILMMGVRMPLLSSMSLLLAFSLLLLVLVMLVLVVLVLLAPILFLL